MLVGLMGVNHGGLNILVAQNPAHRGRVNTIHLHQAVERMSEVMDSRKVLQTGSLGYPYQSIPQVIGGQPMAR